jgi:hypothetical protein
VSHPDLALLQSCSDVPDASIVTSIDHANAILLLKPGNLWRRVGCIVLAAAVGVSAPHTVNFGHPARVDFRACLSGSCKSEGIRGIKVLAVFAKANILASQGAAATDEVSMKRAIEIAGGLEARPLLGGGQGECSLAYWPASGRTAEKFTKFLVPDQKNWADIYGSTEGYGKMGEASRRHIRPNPRQNHRSHGQQI